MARSNLQTNTLKAFASLPRWAAVIANWQRGKKVTNFYYPLQVDSKGVVIGAKATYEVSCGDLPDLGPEECSKLKVNLPVVYTG